MTRLVARLILSMLLLPISVALFAILLVVSTPTGPPPITVVLGVWGVVYGLIAAYWILVWRGVVRWTAQRTRNTILSGVAAVAGSATVAGFLIRFGAAPAAPAILLGGGCGPMVWVFATVLIWRETPGERVARLRGGSLGPTVCCLICGYNLTGLRAACCPECGAQYTLDELFRGNDGHDERVLQEPAASGSERDRPPPGS